MNYNKMDTELSVKIFKTCLEANKTTVKAFIFDYAGYVNYFSVRVYADKRNASSDLLEQNNYGFSKKHYDYQNSNSLYYTRYLIKSKISLLRELREIIEDSGEKLVETKVCLTSISDDDVFYVRDGYDYAEFTPTALTREGYTDGNTTVTKLYKKVYY